jgi:hypothetical protein
MGKVFREAADPSMHRGVQAPRLLDVGAGTVDSSLMRDQGGMRKGRPSPVTVAASAKGIPVRWGPRWSRSGAYARSPCFMCWHLFDPMSALEGVSRSTRRGAPVRVPDTTPIVQLLPVQLEAGCASPVLFDAARARRMLAEGFGKSTFPSRNDPRIAPRLPPCCSARSPEASSRRTGGFYPPA